MDDAPLPTLITKKEEILQSFEIKQEENNYKLNIKSSNKDITLTLLDEKDFLKEFEIKLTIEEIKQMHKIFLVFNSCQEFIDYIKALIDNNKISIKKKEENRVIIELMVEYLFKQNIIEIDLKPKKVDFGLYVQDLYKKISALNESVKNIENNYQNVIKENNNIKIENSKIKEENINIKKEITNLKEENKNLKEDNKNIKEILNNLENKIKCLSELQDLNKMKKIKNILIDSTIIENENEYNMIKLAIKERMNKDIKEIKKIYQATKDGGEAEIFHKKCNNIPNTLVLYKSIGNRRFGGFASECWDGKETIKLDKNCFLFSLDKKKIYPPKNDYYEIDCYSYDGPSFSCKGIYCLEIDGNAIKNKSLRTNEKGHLDLFDGEIQALCEDGNFSGIYAKEYEVFQIQF